ncbi:MAG: hypothetical protein J3K34DRAFT_457140 [Monoraphidium minutum]|nr:MAG: hypothetical protein J3K34DRAFT_457140 [Monoraphidium minutum]
MKQQGAAPAAGCCCCCPRLGRQQQQVAPSAAAAAAAPAAAADGAQVPSAAAAEAAQVSRRAAAAEAAAAPPPGKPPPLPPPRPTFLVMGASSVVGGAVLSELRRHAPAGAVVLGATRGGPGPGLRVLDIEFPESWGPALQGVTGLFMVLPPRLACGAGAGDGPGAPRPAPAKRVFAPFLAAAAAAGVRHVVFLSVQGAGGHRGACGWRGAARRAALPHAAVEAALARSGLPWTAVRACRFMQGLARAPLADGIRERGAIELPAGDAEPNWVDARDAGALAAAALLNPAAAAGAAWDATGERAGYARAAALISAAVGRHVAYRPAAPLPYLWSLLRRGRAPRAALLSLLVHWLPRRAPPPPLSADIETVLGRPPARLEAFVAEHACAWAPRPGAAAAGGAR